MPKSTLWSPNAKPLANAAILRRPTASATNSPSAELFWKIRATVESAGNASESIRFQTVIPPNISFPRRSDPIRRRLVAGPSAAVGVYLIAEWGCTSPVLSRASSGSTLTGELHVNKPLAAIASETKLPLLVTPLPGPTAKKVIAKDTQFVSPSYTRGYPLVAKSGRGAMVEDVDGNVFLDFAAGIAVVSTGHCHPRVVEAIQRQAAELIHISCTDFYYEGLTELAERLAAVAPGKEAKKVYFGNSGTEAIEAAIKLARYHTRRDKIIAFYGCF